MFVWPVDSGQHLNLNVNVSLRVVFYLNCLSVCLPYRPYLSIFYEYFKHTISPVLAGIAVYLCSDRLWRTGCPREWEEEFSKYYVLIPS